MLFRSYVDHSLFLASLDEEARKDLTINGNLEIYNGALYESLVASDLARLGLPLFYYKPSETLELDFVVRIKNEIVPIEVKRNRGRATSLATTLSKNLNRVKTGIKFTHQNIGYQNNILTIPYFLTFLFQTIINDNPIFSWEHPPIKDALEQDEKKSKS